MNERIKGLRFKDADGVFLEAKDWGRDGVVLDAKKADRAALNKHEARRLRDWLSLWLEVQP